MEKPEKLIKKLRSEAYIVEGQDTIGARSPSEIELEAADVIEQLFEEYAKLNQLNDAVSAEYRRLKKELADLKKHGQWEVHLDAVGNMYSECSCCHTTWWDLKNGDKYCSECGAAMDGGKYI